MSWKCNNGHPQVTNHGKKCQLCQQNQPKLSFLKNYQLWLIIISICVISASGLGAYLYFKPCASGLEKKGFKCVKPNIFINPNFN